MEKKELATSKMRILFRVNQQDEHVNECNEEQALECVM